MTQAMAEVDKNEMVRLGLSFEHRIRLYDQIADALRRKGFADFERGIDSLGLGFDVTHGWPIDKDAQPTLAQVIVVAQKLKLKIVISDVWLVR